MGMALDGRTLVLEVGDRGDTAPQPVPPEDGGASGGFGLGLVDALVDRLTIVFSGCGRTIRVALPIGRDTAEYPVPPPGPAPGAGERGPGAPGRD
ncbi:hypothetical protein QZN11_26890 [Streptomyces gramineus]|uniref:hypothetical protein n=1 Tax=Streptomyces gramineus TaxID=910542 RepID=UPI00398A7306